MKTVNIFWWQTIGFISLFYSVCYCHLYKIYRFHNNASLMAKSNYVKISLEMLKINKNVIVCSDEQIRFCEKQIEKALHIIIESSVCKWRMHHAENFN